jgi:hypothetical protein
MKCPQCGADTPDEEWNCVSCRMNVYWASQHYDDLAGLRREQGLRDTVETPPFLVAAHASAMNDRADRGGKVEHKVRQIARRVMSEQGRDRSGAGERGATSQAQDAEPGWKQPDQSSPRLTDVSAEYSGEST